MRITRAIPALAALALALAACGGGGNSEPGQSPTTGGTASTPATEIVTLKVGASPVPHALILQFVDENLAEAAGIDLEIVEFTDYVQPNVALAEGSIDANYFQHMPYFETEVAEKGYAFEASVGIHIEPYGVYSKTLGSLDELPDGATISVPNDPSNQARALKLLEANGVFTLDKAVTSPTIYDLADNPKNVKLVELDAAQLPITLADVDAAVINGNFALEADLVPTRDAIALESGENNPYANIVAYRTADADSAAIATLLRLLTSDEVRTFITETWPDGELIPAF